MSRLKDALAAAVMALLVVCTAPQGIAGTGESPPRVMSGAASWYGPGFHGRLTASGERFDVEALTAAHPSLPFGTRILVTNAANGRSVIVRINDRGPFAGKRILDLSEKAAQVIGMIDRGVAKVKIVVLELA